MFICPECKIKKKPEEFTLNSTGKYPLISVCHKCSDEKLIEKVDCTCSVCLRKLPSHYYQHYKTRIKQRGKGNGMRLRVNTNCKDCRTKENKILNKIKKKLGPPPEYLEKCPWCGLIVYEKSEDIPDGVAGANGPWQCDHNHKGGGFRGYLCKKCNAFGKMEEVANEEDFLKKANERKNGNK